MLPVKSALAEENFQTLLVMKALQQLGYTVKPWEELDYPLIHVAVANGDASFMANHWNPHHAEFYQQAGRRQARARACMQPVPRRAT